MRTPGDARRLGMKPESLSRACQYLWDVGVEIDQNLTTIAEVATPQAYMRADRT